MKSNINLERLLIESIPFPKDDKFYAPTQNSIAIILKYGATHVCDLVDIMTNKDIDILVRQHTIAFLAWLNFKEALPQMLKLGQDTEDSPRIRRTAMIYSSILGQNQAFPVLAEASLHAASPKTRIDAIFGMTISPNENAFDIIKEVILRETNDEVKSQAIRALSSLNVIDAQAIYEILSTIFRNQNEAIIVRAYALEGLGYLRDIRALEIVLANLSHHDAPIRYMAAFSLGMLGNKSHIPLLENLSKDFTDFPDWGTVAQSATQAIRQIEQLES